MPLYKGFEYGLRDIYNTDNHVFVYKIKNNRIIYERTVNCEASAIDRITELKTLYNVNAVYSIGVIIHGAYH